MVGIQDDVQTCSDSQVYCTSHLIEISSADDVAVVHVVSPCRWHTYGLGTGSSQFLERCCGDLANTVPVSPLRIRGVEVVTEVPAPTQFLSDGRCLIAGQFFDTPGIVDGLVISLALRPDNHTGRDMKHLCLVEVHIGRDGQCVADTDDQRFLHGFAVEGDQTGIFRGKTNVLVKCYRDGRLAKEQWTIC